MQFWGLCYNYAETFKHNKVGVMEEPKNVKSERRPSCVRLKPRLQMLAHLVRPGVKVADIGSDHALLPIYLIQNGISPSVLATDVNRGPLENARANAKAHGVGSALQTRLSDGLAEVQAHEAEDIIIAGTGGELIAKIISAAPWLCDENKRLILQPMSRPEVLRAFLYRAGFWPLREEACFEGRRVYIAMQTAYKSGEKKACDAAYKYVGLLHLNKNAAAKEHLNRQLQSLQKKADALKKTNSEQAELSELEDIIKAIKAVLQNKV